MNKTPGADQGAGSGPAESVQGEEALTWEQERLIEAFRSARSAQEKLRIRQSALVARLLGTGMTVREAAPLLYLSTGRTGQLSLEGRGIPVEAFQGECHHPDRGHWCRECGMRLCDTCDCACFACGCPCHGGEFIIHQETP